MRSRPCVHKRRKPSTTLLWPLGPNPIPLIDLAPGARLPADEQPIHFFIKRKGYNDIMVSPLQHFYCQQVTKRHAMQEPYWLAHGEVSCMLYSRYAVVCSSDRISP